jgi:hypothetical protein
MVLRIAQVIIDYFKTTGLLYNNVLSCSINNNVLGYTVSHS